MFLFYLQFLFLDTFSILGGKGSFKYCSISKSNSSILCLVITLFFTLAEAINLQHFKNSKDHNQRKGLNLKLEFKSHLPQETSSTFTELWELDSFAEDQTHPIKLPFIFFNLS